MTKLVERNTTIPARRSEVFTTAADDQPAVEVVVLQGERESAADNRVLGRFQLENIRKAPRGVPQIEVSFDIDANGIVNVSARDKDTGASQQITISDSSTLDQTDIDRMVAAAEANRAQDRNLRELVDARNELDGAAYQVEHRLAELGDRAASHDRSRAELLVAEARTLVQNRSDDLDGLRRHTSELQALYHGLMSDSASVGATVGGREQGTDGHDEHPGDHVIDAEFTTE
jgi:molecular chaperone DnaK